MATYKTPGVYVEEISTLPPSVAPVSTAIPAFIGYTEQSPNKVARIDTLLEYESIFGKAKPSGFKITSNPDTGLKVELKDPLVFLMYYGLSLGC